jgi:hypothetical protein
VGAVKLRVAATVALGIAAGVSAAPGARADSETDVAAQFFEAGASAAKRGDFRVCAEAFTEANKRLPHGATLYNAALCWESAKELARAANDYKTSIKLGNLSSAQEQQAKKRLRSLASKLGEIEVTAPEGARASVGPMKDTVIPFTTFVTPGEVEVKVEGPDGETITKSVRVEAGEHESVGVDRDQPENATPVKPERPEPEAETSSANWQTTAGWVAVGASIVATGAGVGYYMSALSAKNTFEQSNNTDNVSHDAALSRASTARVFFVGAGLAAAAGITLILTAPKPKQNSVSLTLRPTGASATLTF